jgi:glycosyltransferase involved in cell wall biosynthesis
VPTISLVTPSFQQGEFLERTIVSVLDQHYPRLEYVVQDGGSADGTCKVLDRYRARLHRCVSAPDKGQAQAINLGLAGSSGEIMAWLNSDDLLLPGALGYAAGYFARHPEIDCIYGHRVLIDEHDRDVGRWVLPPHDSAVLKWADFVPQETLFWRRRIWERAGGALDPSFQFAMDWDLLVRFVEAGARFARVPRFLGAFRVHARQKTTAQIEQKGMGEMARIRRRLHGREVLPQEIHGQIRPYLMRHVLCHHLYRAGVLRY